MSKPVLVIMAAGMGSRFGGLKQIEPVSGKDEIILDFSLFDAKRAGFEKAIIIIKEENEKDFRALLDNRAGREMEIVYKYQALDNIPEGYTVPEGRQKPWGTAHAVLSAAPAIDGNFAVINADDFYGPEAFKLIYDFLESADSAASPAPFCMVGYPVENTLTENGHVSRGVCEEENGYLKDIHERTKIMWRDGKIVYIEGSADSPDGETVTYIPEGTTVSMNFWGFTPLILEKMQEGFPEFLDKTLAENPLKGEYLLPKCVDELLKADLATAKVLRSNDRWWGVTYKEDKPSVVSALQELKDKGVYPENLW